MKEVFLKNTWQVSENMEGKNRQVVIENCIDSQEDIISPITSPPLSPSKDKSTTKAATSKATVKEPRKISEYFGPVKDAINQNQKGSIVDEMASDVISMENGNQIKDKDKTTKRWSRELNELNATGENIIMSARLRSDSGKTYSTGMTINTTSSGSDITAIPEEQEGEEPTITQIGEPYAQDKNFEQNMFAKIQACSQGQCCKNTNTLIEMMQQLQKSMNDIQDGLTVQNSYKAELEDKMENIQECQSHQADEIQELKLDLKQCLNQVKFLSGVVTRQEQQIDMLTRRQTLAFQKSMSSNLVFAGIKETQGENVFQVVQAFIEQNLEISELIPLESAQRFGKGKNRPILLELRHVRDKRKIFERVSKLKGQRNSDGDFYFVSEQLPEEFNENKRRINDLITENKKKPTEEQMSMKVSRGTLLVNGTPYNKAVQAPRVSEVLHPTATIIHLSDELEYHSGKAEYMENSKFQGFAVAVKDHDDVNAAYYRIKLKYPAATHISCAYRLPGNNGPQNQDFCDDGEHGAGRTMLNLLKSEKLMNIAIFMVRIYGGKNIGPARFDIFKQVCLAAIKELRRAVEEMKAKEKRLEEEREQQRYKELIERANQKPMENTPLEDWSNTDA